MSVQFSLVHLRRSVRVLTFVRWCCVNETIN